jgi:hypothetical protein
VMQIVIEGVIDEVNARLIDDMCEAVIHLLVEDGRYLQLFNWITDISTTIESNTEGESRTVAATITFSVEYEEVYVTRVPDTLDRIQLTVPIPGQPAVPAGEKENAIDIPIEFRAPTIDHHNKLHHERVLRRTHQ